ncbi:MAG: DUF3307 domain-containing protein [Candidatus Omnitrophota bacterium]|nr:DUF3307 domain-containing protein [Candidatus Omnitrophota bacterium]
MTLVLLLALHHLADVAFQPSRLITAKKKHLWAHYEHAFLWAATVALGLILTGRYDPWEFAFLLVGHLCIDNFFYRVLPALKGCEKKYGWVYADQALHYLQILIVWL